eukprot:SAG22_NODE_1283_length_4886_cov_53.568414_4_plen_424_part_00
MVQQQLLVVPAHYLKVTVRSVATPSAPGDCQCFSTAGQHPQINFLVTSMQTATRNPVSLAHESNCALQIPAFQNVAPCLVLCVCVSMCVSESVLVSLLLSLFFCLSLLSAMCLSVCFLSVCSCVRALSLSLSLYIYIYIYINARLFSLRDALSLLCMTVFSLFYFSVSACVSSFLPLSCAPPCILLLSRICCYRMSSWVCSSLLALSCLSPCCACRPPYVPLCSCLCALFAALRLLFLLYASAPFLRVSLCVCCCPVLALLSVSLPLAFLPLYSVSALSPLLVFSCSNYYFSSLPGLLFSLFVLYSAARVCCGLSSVFSTLSSLLLPAFSLAARACLRLLSLSLPSLPAVMCLPLPVHLLQRPVTPSGFFVFVQAPERHRILAAPVNLEATMRAVSSKAKCGCSAAEQHSMRNILVTSTRTSN